MPFGFISYIQLDTVFMLAVSCWAVHFFPICHTCGQICWSHPGLMPFFCWYFLKNAARKLVNSVRGRHPNCYPTYYTLLGQLFLKPGKTAPACTIPWPLELAHFYSAINYTCDFPAMTCQHVYCKNCVYQTDSNRWKRNLSCGRPFRGLELG